MVKNFKMKLDIENTPNKYLDSMKWKQIEIDDLEEIRNRLDIHNDSQMVGRLEKSYKRRKRKTKTKQRKLRREKKTVEEFTGNHAKL